MLLAVQSATPQTQMNIHGWLDPHGNKHLEIGTPH